MKIVIDLPPKELKPNSRAHHRAVAEAKQRYREHAKEEAMAAAFQAGLQAPIYEAVVGITYYHKTAKMQDRDNILASLKSAFDGFTDAGIWTDDRDVIFLPVVREKGGISARVEITIYQNVTETWNEFVGSLKEDG